MEALSFRANSASPSRGEDDAPRVSADVLLRASPQTIAEALTRSARLGGGVFCVRGPSPPPDASSDLDGGRGRGDIGDRRLSRGRIALPPPGGGVGDPG